MVQSDTSIGTSVSSGLNNIWMGGRGQGWGRVLHVPPLPPQTRASDNIIKKHLICLLSANLYNVTQVLILALITSMLYQYRYWLKTANLLQARSFYKLSYFPALFHHFDRVVHFKEPSF